MIDLILTFSIINLSLLFLILFLLLDSDFTDVLQRLEGIRKQLFLISWKINKKNLTNKK